jgi:putative hydrolase of the HAD superfamily
MSIDAVVFDLFGTLIPKWNTVRSAVVLERMARLLGLPLEKFVAAWVEAYADREIGRVTLRECVARTARSLGGDVAEERVDAAHGMWAALIATHVRPRDAEVVKTLAAIRSRGRKVGLISNCSPEIPALVRTSDFASFIDHATFSCEIGLAKPDPRIFQMHCRELGVQPGRSLYLGDGGSNELHGAQSVGMEPIFLRIVEEIAAEGLPEAVAAWTGRELTRLGDILDCLDAG